MIDPELKYCPSCHDEYRAEIEQCAACEVVLITGAQKMALEKKRQENMSRRKGELAPEDEVVAIERGSLHDLKRLEDLLAAERIGTRLIGDEQSCSKSCCPSHFYLQVRKEDAVDALQLLARDHQRTTGLDAGCHAHGEEVYNPHAGEAICPACGFRFSTSAATCPDCGLCFS
jgi:hypothetical protein